MEEKFFNRELSWLEFNERVLQQALNTKLPLMERLKFLSIVSSNFDEFFQVRVASVKRLAISSPRKRASSGFTPKSLLHQISSRAHKIIKKQHTCLMQDIIPSLAEKGIVYTPIPEYTTRQIEYSLNIFQNEIFPLLTPLRTDSKEFPHVNNLKLHVAFLLTPIEGISADANKQNIDNSPCIALVQVPSALQSVVWLPSDAQKKQFTLLNDIIELYGTQLFPGFTVREKLFFKVMRDADFAVDEDADTNFINAMENVLAKRQSSFAVAMICNNSSSRIKDFLCEKLALAEEDVYTVSDIIDPTILAELYNIDESVQLSIPEWNHFYPSDLPKKEPLWDTIKQHDVLLHVPYESYEPVVKFITDAANDDNVLAIKMTLYRTGNDSPIVAALEKAARHGKQVTVLVELKARFDEEQNIAWAEQLEKAGAIVIYGLVNLKVHAKILYVIRREGDMLKRYVHISTGNYNTKTAKLYSDLSIFTANSEIANDATVFFNLVTGYSTLQPMKYLSVAPVTLKDKILSLIEREIEHAKSGNGGLIVAKMNSLTHEEIISALYRASCSGVKIMLNVRGICMLVPGVKKMSENISVISIVDRYLEHARIFYFQNNGSPELYLASADWMPRNLERRVELMCPILDKKIFSEVKKILDTYFDDTTNSHVLNSDGSWKMRDAKKTGNATKRAQEILYNRYKRIAEETSRDKEREFKVRRKN